MESLFCNSLITLIPWQAFTIFSFICSLKFSFSSRWTSKCFWLGILTTGELLKNTGGWVNLVPFSGGNIFFSLFRNIRTEENFPLIIFHWYFLYILFLDIITKSFAFVKRYFVRLFILIRKNNGPNMVPWGTPDKTGNHADLWSIKISLWYLFFQKTLY